MQLKGVIAYRPIALLIGLGLAVLLASRLVLFSLYADRVSATADWLTLLLWGLRADLIMLGYWALLILLPAPLLLGQRRWWLQLSVRR